MPEQHALAERQGMKALLSDPDAPPALLPELTPQQLIARREQINNLVNQVMILDTHYGTVPGTKGKRLFKPGADALFSLFRIAAQYSTEDLKDGEHFRYRVTCRAVTMTNGLLVGEGLGEASTAEEKYAWRKAVCKEEFNEAADDKRRVKWSKKYNKPAERTEQVRTNPSDQANTVLKMAKKRALVDCCIAVLACADMFENDGPPPGEKPDRGSAATAGGPPPQGSSDKPRQTSGTTLVSANQIKQIRAQCDRSQIPATSLCKQYGIESIEDLPASFINEALAWIRENGESQ